MKSRFVFAKCSVRDIRDQVEPTAGPAMSAVPDCDRILRCSKMS